MSIESKNNVDVKGYQVKMDNQIKFYKGDTLNLGFSISHNLISNMGSAKVVDGVLPVGDDSIKAYVLVGGVSEIAGAITENNEVIFRLEPKYQALGTTQLQIVLKELKPNGEIDVLHLPPFSIDIAEPIMSID